MLKGGVYHPIHTRYGYAATTRTTSSAPNIQNFRKKRGIRECLMPRPGCCFVETDYPSLELFTLAQVCAWKLDRHDLVKNMNEGKDYHAVIAAGILRTTYEDIMARKGTDSAVKNARDCGKYGNYGLCGYMTDPRTFALYVNLGSRTDENPRGLQWTADQAAEVMALWRRNATDPVAFLKYVDTLKNRIGLYDVEIPGTSIVRRGCTRTAAANTHFQGLGATVARRAGWKIATRQYIDGTMPGRTVVFCHDAFLGECSIEARDELAVGQEECMAEAMAEICPNMRIYPELEAKRRGLKNVTVIDSAAQDHYSKFAKSKRDEKGRLIICQV
jgi:DNA polymerase I-like protein with 3'-5' exonuclease and polymerase domains